MSANFAKLATQGRAYNSMRAWTEQELEALLRLEKERKVPRLTAADFIRNGILSLEAYDAAVEAKFVPKTAEDAQKAAEAALQDNQFSGKQAAEETPPAPPAAPADPAADQTPPPPAPPVVDRAALEARAKELGVSFNPNISDEKLAKRVAEAEEAAKSQ